MLLCFLPIVAHADTVTNEITPTNIDSTYYNDFTSVDSSLNQYNSIPPWSTVNSGIINNVIYKFTHVYNLKVFLDDGTKRIVTVGSTTAIDFDVTNDNPNLNLNFKNPQLIAIGPANTTYKYVFFSSPGVTSSNTFIMKNDGTGFLYSTSTAGVTGVKVYNFNKQLMYEKGTTDTVTAPPLPTYTDQEEQAIREVGLLEANPTSTYYHDQALILIDALPSSDTDLKAQLTARVQSAYHPLFSDPGSSTPPDSTSSSDTLTALLNAVSSVKYELYVLISLVMMLLIFYVTKRRR